MMNRISILTLTGLIAISVIQVWGQVSPVAPGPPPMAPSISPVSVIPSGPAQVGPGPSGGTGYSPAVALAGKPRRILDHALTPPVRHRLQDALDSIPK
jgi:hypothetical protein